MFQVIGVGKYSIIIIMIFVTLVPSASAQLQPELTPSEQICEQMEISNRLYNPVTIIMGYEKATIRTPEVIVSKSNPDAVIPIQILDTNLNMNTNSTGRFVAKVDLMYAAPSDMPRLVTYNIISGRGGIELERGTWLVDGRGFCKVITFTVTEEPHIPTTEEFAAQAKEITAVELKANREEQVKTNDIMTFIVFSLIGLICAILVGKVISVLMIRHDNITAKKLLEKLRKASLRLDDANTNLKLSRELNDILNQTNREQNIIILDWFEKSFPKIISQLKTHLDESMRDLVFGVDHALKNNKPLEFVPKPVEIITEQMPDSRPKKKLNESEFPKIIQDGISLLGKGIDMIPDNPLTDKLKNIVQKQEPETFEDWYEHYNKVGSREELLKEYELNKKEYESDKLNPLKEAKARACYQVLVNRESKLD